ncbi:ATP-binding protein [Candidatus Desulfovibrio trichonymphae]|uniref:ATP-binding protein n=1 Tax=Candidatus Desulfovibrio trichonymphae TaxID=1725232 RepID=UPI000BBAA282|nr:hypothetical protein [Candidatus Desulfovibrio trichonymphae]
MARRSRHIWPCVKITRPVPKALPLIMDEILVNFDLQRAERTVRAFAALTSGSDGKSHQMLYFTCQPHMADMLRRVAPDAALFAVADGNIRQV